MSQPCRLRIDNKRDYLGNDKKKTDTCFELFNCDTTNWDRVLGHVQLRILWQIAGVLTRSEQKHCNEGCAVDNEG